MAHTTQPATPNEAFLMQQNNALFLENHKRSQNKQLLYTEWQKANSKKLHISNVIIQLQPQLLALKINFKYWTNRRLLLKKQYSINNTGPMNKNWPKKLYGYEKEQSQEKKN